MAKAKRAAPRKAERALWRNRIVGLKYVDPRALKANPLNWRMHPDSQKRAMGDALAQVGVLNVVVVNQTTGNVLDGHMRRDLAIEHHEPTVAALYVKLTAEEERLALATINPLAELGATDPEKLAELLAGVERKGGPLDELLASLEEQASAAVVKNVGGSTGSRAVGRSNMHTMRAVLAVPDIAVVERAIGMTGIPNRGEALVTICREYLGSHDDNADRQHDAGAKGVATDELEEAFAQGAPGT